MTIVIPFITYQNNFNKGSSMKVVFITLISFFFFVSEVFCNKLLDAGWWRQEPAIEDIENGIRLEDINEQNKNGYTALMFNVC